ncbi:MAG: ATP phosphoribosyltransferase regulatory subunit [Nitrospinae bacterium]|nr:ATP phosphoribosyltransferase regulatory subunit [Nitrospinota bacterium]
MRDAPRGLRALLYGEAAAKGRLERDALSLFERWGYCRVETPSMEFLHILARGLDPEAMKRVITFTDPAGGGKPLALRPDVTPQIARIAATALAGKPAPIRLCYVATVYRSAAPGTGNRMELLQAGAELIGVNSPSADAEIIALAAESLQKLIPGKAKIAVSHIGYITAAMEALGLDGVARNAVKRALAKKNTRELAAALDGANAKGAARKALLSAPSLFGGPGILRKAPVFGAGSRQAIDQLRRVADDLKRYGVADFVAMDLGETRGLGYYTGVTFEGFAGGIGRSVLSGGRYDQLLSLYGEGRPATGFAMDLNAILDNTAGAAKDEGWTLADVLVTGPAKSGEAAIKLAAALRGKGLKVARDLAGRSIPGAVKYARQMRMAKVAVAGEPKGRVKLIDTATGSAEVMTVEKLLRSIGARARKNV